MRVKTVAGRAGSSVVLIAVVLCFPLVLGSYHLLFTEQVIYTAVAVMSVGLVTGMIDQLNLGQGAVVGVGAYTTVLAASAGLGLWTCLLLSAAVGALAGAIIALPALRVRGINVALVTFAVAAIFPQVILKFPDATGGASGQGLTGDFARPAALAATHWTFWILVVVAAGVFAVVWLFRTSLIGKAILLARDQPTAATCFGINISAVIVTLYTIAAAIAGIAGWMFAVSNRFVAPADFHALYSIMLLVVMIVGGSSSTIIGPLFGAAFYIAGNTYLQSLGLDASLSPALFGIALILVLGLLPNGVESIGSRLPALLRRPGGRRQGRDLSTVPQ